MFGEWFNLPRLEKSTFTELMSAKLSHDSERGYRTAAKTDLLIVSSILENILKEQIRFVGKCFICSEKASIVNIEYVKIDTRKFSSDSLCVKCSQMEDVYTIYSMKFLNLITE